MEAIVQWIPTAIACLILLALGAAVGFTIRFVGRRVTERWTLGLTLRPMVVASYALFASVAIVLVRILVSTVGITTDSDVPFILTRVVGNSALTTFVASLGLVLLHGSRRLFRRILHTAPRATWGAVRAIGWCIAVTYVLVIGLAVVVLPAAPLRDLTGTAAIDNGARMFGLFGVIICVALFAWQLVPITTDAMSSRPNSGEHSGGGPEA